MNVKSENVTVFGLNVFLKVGGLGMIFKPSFPPHPPVENLLAQFSYLVDPASSHMLVSKIKPCMSKYKLLYTVKLRMAH